jgi:hypothetical protein
MVRRDDRALPFIVAAAGVARGTVRTIHIQAAKSVQAQTRRTVCGRTLDLFKWQMVSATESRVQMMVCDRCAKA